MLHILFRLMGHKVLGKITMCLYFGMDHHCIKGVQNNAKYYLDTKARSYISSLFEKTQKWGGV